MLKLFCLLVIVAVAVAMPSGTSENVPAQEVTGDVQTVANENGSENAATVDGSADPQEDMDKAETFGYGYRKIIHVYPHYYPRYYYGGYYPRYYYGHYGHYW